MIKPTSLPKHNIAPVTPFRLDGLDAARYALGAVVALTAVAVLAFVPGNIGFTSAMAYGSGSALGAALLLLLLNLLYRSVVNPRPQARSRRAGGRARGSSRLIRETSGRFRRQPDRVEADHTG